MKKSNSSTFMTEKEHFEEENYKPTRATLRVNREKMSLLDLEEVLEYCATKLAFIGDSFGRDYKFEFEISNQTLNGLLIILNEIMEDIEFVAWIIQERRKKGLIIEKMEGNEHVTYSRKENREEKLL